MLSYRHAFHAGNPADVIKHSILIHSLRHMMKKDKSFLYVDTHAGAGLYELTTGFADRNREYLDGISRFKTTEPEQLTPLIQDYLDVVESFNPTKTLEFYPGSPLIAKKLLRPQDQLRLHELHTSDVEIIQSHVASDSRVLLQKKDGLRGMIKAFPPPSRRSLVLIDPPYENKNDYAVIPYAIDDALFKFPSATILIWYPMLENHLFQELKEDLSRLPVSSWMNVELQVRTPGPGLYGSGMWIINPPWNLPQAIEASRDLLLKTLSQDSGANLIVESIIP